MGCYSATTLCVNVRTVLGEAVYSLTKCGNMGALSGPTYAPFGYGLVAMQDVTATYATKEVCVAPYLWLSSGPDQASAGSGRYIATADDYAAVSVIFGVILTAACVIWGAKQVYNLLRNRPES